MAKGGTYFFESGRLTVAATAHAATGGFLWLINPAASGVLVLVQGLKGTSAPTAATAFVTAPRITVERVTFTGAPTGAAITPVKQDSNDGVASATVRLASTGLTLTAVAGAIGSYIVPSILTAVGFAMPIEQHLYGSIQGSDPSIILREGEGIVVRQADAGSTSDTRLLTIKGEWSEV